MSYIKTYLYRVGIGLSILLNAILGGRDFQTFSARNYQWHLEDKKNIYKLIDFMFMDKEHCYKSWLNWKRLK